MKKLCCLGLSLMLVFLCGCSNSGFNLFDMFDEFDSMELYMFEEIEQCEKIVENKSEDAIVTVMETPSTDKKLRSLPYEEFWGCEYASDEMEFTLYAYVFQDYDTASKYYRRAASRTSNDSIEFSISGNFFHYTNVMISDTRVCAVYTKGKHEKATRDYLNSIFTELIKESTD